jgi:hypothetical protein
MQKHCTFIVLILIVSSSCSAPIQEGTPPTSTAQVPTNTKPPAPTVTATATVPVPVPTVNHSIPAGLYTMYAGPEGIWISEPDGNSLTKLTDLGIDRINLSRVRSPNG